MNSAVIPATPSVDLSPPPVPRPPDSLFLDFDGTLAPIAARPDAVRIAPYLPELLADARDRLEGRLAVISGRPLDLIDRFLPLDRLAASGSHGIEIRHPDGTLDRPAADDALRVVVEAFTRFAEQVPGALVEQKPYGVGLHYRAVPSAEDESVALADALARETGLILQRGNMVAELRMPGRDKGGALRDLMQSPHFRGSRPLFVGDDITDEDGFAAALQAGGAGVLVGPVRPTLAGFRLADVDAVLRWLALLARS